MGVSSFYPTETTPEHRRAFLDDLMALSLRYGLVLDSPYGNIFLHDLSNDWDGYCLGGVHKTCLDLLRIGQEAPPGDIAGRRRSELSSHERIRPGLVKSDLQIDFREVEVLQGPDGELDFVWRGHRIAHPAMSTMVSLAEPRDEPAEQHLMSLK